MNWTTRRFCSKLAEFQWEDDGPLVARVPGHVNCLDSWTLFPGA